MSIARNIIKGLIFYNSYQSFNGLNIITPVDGNSVWMIDMKGSIINHWEMGYKSAGYTELLPNGNILYSGKLDTINETKNIPGSSGILIEKDWNDNIVWKYSNKHLHDSFLRLKNGNTIIIKWCKIPDYISKNINCGYQKFNDCKEVWGDKIQEIDINGNIVWQWIAHEHLDPDLDIGCPLCSRIAWPHINSFVLLDDGNILLNLYKNNTLIIIDRKNGNILWRWGMEELAHPYSLSLLDNGNILLFDSGYHRKGISMSNSRILEIIPYKGEIVWCFEEKTNHGSLFYSSSISSCQKLPNGNILVCEGNTGRIFEITENYELIWEYVNNLPMIEMPIVTSKHNKLFSAYRYGIDYSGLWGNKNTSNESQSSPGTVNISEKNVEESVLKRLQQLGY